MAHHHAARQRALAAIMAISVALVTFAALPVRLIPVARASATYSFTVLADGPVSYWRLGEQSGTTAFDSGMGANNGTFTGGYTPGVAGAISSDTNTAVGFNGATGYVSVPDNANLDITGDLTIEVWAKPGLLNGTTQTVLQKGTNASSAGTGWQYRISINSANHWKGIIFVGTTSYEIIDNADTLSTSRWDHLVLVRSGSTLTFYVNGQSVGNIAVSGPTNTTTGMLAFGRAGGYSNYYLNGSVDEVAIYSTALTASQIQNHFTVANTLDGGPTPTPTATPAPTLPPTPTATVNPNDPVVMAAADIACDAKAKANNGGNGTSIECQEKWTAQQLTGISAVLPVGDEQYDCGTLTQFQQSYDPTWGQQKAITRPAVGNHEYKTICGNGGGAGGYYTYFGAAASPLDTNCTVNCKGYYSYDIGAWHIIVINSECSQVSGCQAGSAQEQWLQADLAAHPAACTLAYWHRPYYTSGWSVGDAEMHDIWVDLYNANADLVLNGHDHDYERFLPQDANATYDPAHGIMEIIVGTGGDSHGGFNGTAANSSVRDGTTYGVLRLTLHATSYDWQFQPDGHSGSFTDAGSAACH
ncbi:MAG TPA: LamG-like jellyroll fold domain-containing protein [Ktedonobacterales bacterium]|nr:LamG-like jellyroll fold domain-containing protein [Ktedonobacterales bacterium]